MNSAIILAAGNSTRMGSGKSKQLIMIKENPVLSYALKAFQACKEIDEIILAAKEEDIPYFQQMCKKYEITKVKNIVFGGKTRQESAAKAMNNISIDDGFVIIHDGARPLITEEEIKATIQDAKRYGASVIGVPVKDTIKKVNKNQVVIDTPKRQDLWAVHTPQIFKKAEYICAMEKAIAKGEDYTDDCQLMEHSGIEVHICKGSYNNIKITTEEDIHLAESILYERELRK